MTDADRIAIGAHLMTIGQAFESIGSILMAPEPETPEPTPQPVLAPLFDLIGKAESRHKNFPRGNYNAHWSRAGNVAEPRFTGMTLDQVIGWQRSFVAGGKPSSAVGRYQIIRSTLLDLMGWLSLSGSELFDEPMQDRMAVRLLDRRGVRSWLAGQMTDDAFINELAKEWAGLPNTSGKSHYGGDGLNKATVSVDQVRRAMKEVKA